MKQLKEKKPMVYNKREIEGVKMSILENIRQIDWQIEDNRNIAGALVADAAEYMKRVEAHIYRGNEIRADEFMDFAEKQDEISRLDRKRTEAHNRMLSSFAPFLDLLKQDTFFDESKYKLSNRTQIADFVALIALEIMGIEPTSRKEGEIRDELAEKLHQKEINYEQFADIIPKLTVEKLK